MKNKRYNVKVSSEWIIYRHKDWFKENKITQYSWFYGINGEVHISFKKEEDAMAFKLRWQ